MRKILTLLTAVLLVGSVWATDPRVTLDFTNAGWDIPTTDQTEAANYENGGYTITVSATHKLITTQGQTPTPKALLFGKKDATLTLPAMSFNVSKIVVNGATSSSSKVTFNIYVGTNAVSTEATSSLVNHDFTIASASQATGTVYVIKVTNANNCQISSVEFYEAVAGAPENPTFSIEAGAYSTTQSVELDCETEDAAIYYTLNGTTPTSTSTLYSGTAIEISETTTIKAIAIKNGVSSSVVTATYTILSGLTGNGTKENPFTVEDVYTLNNASSGPYWVIGYIVGCAANGGDISTGAAQASNIALGDATDQTTSLVPVQLVNNTDTRTALNIVDHPSYVGAKVKVHGSLESYFQTSGVKSTDDYEIISTPTALETVESAEKAVKTIVNGQLFIEKNGHVYNAMGQMVK